MGTSIVEVIGHSLITPLGIGVQTNYQQIMAGRSALTLQRAEDWHVNEDFYAGIIPDELLSSDIQGSRPFRLALQSLRLAMGSDKWDNCERTQLFLATTKGDIDIPLPMFAQQLNEAIGLCLPPVVVSNACTSGVCAQVAAQRAIQSGRIDCAIVCGVEVVSRFIVSGFQSLHAMSTQPCQPFSMNRMGINLGEAAVSIIYHGTKVCTSDRWLVVSSAISSDAYHISAPSKHGTGSAQALTEALGNLPHEQLAFINVHGTGTLFNDEMEAQALNRASLNEIPIFSLKGYYGHTMGAAGLLETLISMESVENHSMPATLGYDEDLGTSLPVKVSSTNQPVEGRAFLKLISGFGGSNAVVLMVKRAPNDDEEHSHYLLKQENITITQKHRVRIESDGRSLTELYRELGQSYPKFYKMDALSRLGYIASEKLLNKETEERFISRKDRAIVLFSRNGCHDCDSRYFETIRVDKYFPSPSLFVYSLPNIVAGEIAIRNQYQGEASFYLLDQPDEDLMLDIIKETFQNESTHSILGGWVDYTDPSHFLADLCIYTKQ